MNTLLLVWSDQFGCWAAHSIHENAHDALETAVKNGILQFRIEPA